MSAMTCIKTSLAHSGSALEPFWRTQTREAKSSENITPDLFAARFEQALKGVLTSWVLEITRWNH